MMFTRWLFAYALTQLVEIGVYVHAHAKRRPLPERIAIAFALSGVTHPIVTYVIPEIVEQLTGSWWTMAAVAETFAVLAEAALLFAFGVRGALAWALLANAASFTLGLFIFLYLRPSF